MIILPLICRQGLPLFPHLAEDGPEVQVQPAKIELLRSLSISLFPPDIPFSDHLRILKSLLLFKATILNTKITAFGEFTARQKSRDSCSTQHEHSIGRSVQSFPCGLLLFLFGHSTLGGFASLNAAFRDRVS